MVQNIGLDVPLAAVLVGVLVPLMLAILRGRIAPSRGHFRHSLSMHVEAIRATTTFETFALSPALVSIGLVFRPPCPPNSKTYRVASDRLADQWHIRSLGPCLTINTEAARNYDLSYHMDQGKRYKHARIPRSRRNACPGPQQSTDAGNTGLQHAEPQSRSDVGAERIEPGSRIREYACLVYCPPSHDTYTTCTSASALVLWKALSARRAPHRGSAPPGASSHLR